jgi:hypothetical protein
LLKEFEGRIIISADTGFHSKEGDPENLKICAIGTWILDSDLQPVDAMARNQG